MKEPGAGPGPGGSRVAIIMNGSPLFSGDAGSGESEIRRHVLENDLLEALIALPEQLFYNTGIATYVWLLTNRKKPARRGRIQLIDATSFWTQMKRSLGDKRREIPIEKADEILGLLAESRDGGNESRRRGRGERGGRGQPGLPDDPVRIPKGDGRAAAEAELPDQ